MCELIEPKRLQWAGKGWGSVSDVDERAINKFLRFTKEIEAFFLYV